MDGAIFFKQMSKSESFLFCLTIRFVHTKEQWLDVAEERRMLGEGDSHHTLSTIWAYEWNLVIAEEGGKRS